MVTGGAAKRWWPIRPHVVKGKPHPAPATIQKVPAVQKHLAALGLALGLALPAAATDLDNLTDAQRDAFRAEVRAYLLYNPEVLMEAIAVLESRNAEAEVGRDAAAVAANADAIFGSAFDVVLGNPEGDVTVVEFMDYRCGFCRRAHPEMMDLIELDGNIRLVVKELPILGDQSLLAARFAIATRIGLGDAAYFAVHDALMGMRGDVSEAALVALTDGLGLDSGAIMAAIDDPLVQTTIDHNRALAQRLSISGTPTFVFGDQMVRGYVPLDGMQQIVTMLRDGDN